MPSKYQLILQTVIHLSLPHRHRRSLPPLWWSPWPYDDRLSFNTLLTFNKMPPLKGDCFLTVITW